MQEIASLAAEGRFDYLVIESTGISEPMPVAATFSIADVEGRTLADFTRLDTMVSSGAAAGGVNPCLSSIYSRQAHSKRELATPVCDDSSHQCPGEVGIMAPPVWNRAAMC